MSGRDAWNIKWPLIFNKMKLTRMKIWKIFISSKDS